MKRFTTSLITILIVVSSVDLQLNAQGFGIPANNSKLRNLFGNLDLPVNNKHFNYDMACHMADSNHFKTNCPDTISSDIWYRVYGEMFSSAYDTLLFEKPDDVYNDAHSYSADTIPFGIMLYDFYKFKSTALNTNTYFDFDVVNNKITDKYPRPSYPYNEHQAFTASPLLEESYFSDPVFRIDPAFILYDGHNSVKFGNEYILRIDFGDGGGWVHFNASTTTHRQINYSNAGKKVIRTELMHATTKYIANSSVSSIYVYTSAKLPSPSSTISLPGLNIGLYSGCNSSGTSSGKLVIYLSGFDILDYIPAFNRTLEEIYYEMISLDKIVQLKNQGYSFVVVDFKNSTIDMRFNALYVLNLLEYLKCNLDQQHQFVIMGESMGGLIGRFVMTYMESNHYDNQDVNPFFVDAGDANNGQYLSTHPNIFTLPTNWCLTPKRHNTRLLITLDSPHQGANVPLSLQHAYSDVLKVLSDVFSFDVRQITSAYNLFLDGMAAKQMLIYHVDSKSGNNYSADQNKNEFFGQLQLMGDYPVYCKVTSLSNGSLSGRGQTNHYTHNDRTAGDRLLDINGEIKFTMLSQRFTLVDVDLECLTNPSSSGQIYDAHLGLFIFSLNIYLFGIDITFGLDNIINESASANVLPLCTSPGGYVGDAMPIGDQASHSRPSFKYEWMRYFFDYNIVNNGMGCFSANARYGIQGLSSHNFDFSACTDGMHFTLVPLQSALDYDVLGNTSLNHDIESENINTKLSKVKPDVVIGYPGIGSYMNRQHTGPKGSPFRNPDILNLTLIPAPISPYTYYSCIGRNDAVTRGLINLEVGDEELYLENAELAWHSLYQAEFDIRVNERNPNLNYPSSPLSATTIDGVYSRETPYTISLGGLATYYTDKFNSPTGIGMSYSAPHSGTYVNMELPLNICCINYIGARLQPDEKLKLIPEDGISLKVFPNPSENSQIVVAYQMPRASIVQLEVYTSLGQKVYEESLIQLYEDAETNVIIQLSPQLLNGAYFLNLRQDEASVSRPFVIKRR